MKSDNSRWMRMSRARPVLQDVPFSEAGAEGQPQHWPGCGPGPAFPCAANLLTSTVSVCCADLVAFGGHGWFRIVDWSSSQGRIHLEQLAWKVRSVWVSPSTSFLSSTRARLRLLLIRLCSYCIVTVLLQNNTAHRTLRRGSQFEMSRPTFSAVSP